MTRKTSEPKASNNFEPDPWLAAVTKYPIGSTVEGAITNVTDFGVFVQLEEGIEGLVHVSEISKEKVKTPVETFKVGENLQHGH